MEWGTIAGLVTALATMVTAVGGIYLGHRMQSTSTRVEQVHHIVNQQRTDMVQYQKSLIAALIKAGIEVPDDQSSLE